MNKKIISIITTGCLCLGLISTFLVSSHESTSKNIHKKGKIISQEKQTKIKSSFGVKGNKKTFGFIGEDKFILESLFPPLFFLESENINQQFYGKNFYFMLFGVIKNIN